MTIPIEHAKKVCMPDHVNACAYFSTTEHGMLCVKGTYLEAEIVARLAAGTSVSKGDNCPGVIQVDLRIRREKKDGDELGQAATN